MKIRDLYQPNLANALKAHAGEKYRPRISNGERRGVEMEEHINQWAARMIHFCESRGLLSYLNKE